MKIYWYPVINDYVFIGGLFKNKYCQEGAWSMDDLGKRWYELIYTREFELVAEVED